MHGLTPLMDADSLTDGGRCGIEVLGDWTINARTLRTDPDAVL